MTNPSLEQLQEKIGYSFKDLQLLVRALTHSSFSNEQKINKNGHYERLEFLGDAVLELISSEFLFQTYPEMPEGEMTKLRASLVCEQALSDTARSLNLGAFLRLGKGEEGTGGRDRDSILCDVTESIIGAIYLDGATEGFSAAKTFVLRYILNDIEDKTLFYDAKSTLQEYFQSMKEKDFRYVCVGETGPEHEKTFLVELLVRDTCLGKGAGRTKKAAEQQAAYEVLRSLREQGHVFKKH